MFPYQTLAGRFPQNHQKCWSQDRLVLPQLPHLEDLDGQFDTTVRRNTHIVITFVNFETSSHFKMGSVKDNVNNKNGPLCNMNILYHYY